MPTLSSSEPTAVVNPASALRVMAGMVAALCAVSSAASQPAGPAAQTYVCPDKIQLPGGGPADAALPGGWTLSVPAAPVRLSGVSAFDGPPEEGAALKPASETASGKAITWKFEGPFEGGKWLACDYGGGVARAVVRVADASVACTARVERRKSPPGLAARFECR